MKKITTEISMIEGDTYYEIFVDGKRHQGTYALQNYLEELEELESELEDTSPDEVKE